MEDSVMARLGSPRVNQLVFKTAFTAFACGASVDFSRFLRIAERSSLRHHGQAQICQYGSALRYHPFFATHGVALHRNALNAINSTVPTGLADFREAVPVNNHGSIPQVSVHDGFHKLKPRADVRED